MVTEQMCEQLAQSHYTNVELPAVELDHHTTAKVHVLFRELVSFRINTRITVFDH